MLFSHKSNGGMRGLHQAFFCWINPLYRVNNKMNRTDLQRYQELLVAKSAEISRALAPLNVTVRFMVVFNRFFPKNLLC